MGAVCRYRGEGPLRLSCAARCGLDPATAALRHCVHPPHRDAAHQRARAAGAVRIRLPDGGGLRVLLPGRAGVSVRKSARGAGAQGREPAEPLLRAAPLVAQLADQDSAQIFRLALAAQLSGPCLQRRIVGDALHVAAAAQAAARGGAVAPRGSSFNLLSAGIGPRSVLPA